MVVPVGTLTVALTPAEVVVSALNTASGLPRYRMLYISGDRSAVLSGVRRPSTNLDIQCAHTPHQLRSILQEARHPFILVEHDPAFYEQDRSIIVPVAMAMREASRTAAVLYCAAGQDAAVRVFMKLADRVFHLELEYPQRQQIPAFRKRAPSSRQTTLNAG